jgi:hypothetical protein
MRNERVNSLCIEPVDLLGRLALGSRLGRLPNRWVQSYNERGQEAARPVRRRSIRSIRRLLWAIAQARWCVRSKVETTGGVFQMREDEPTPRVGSALHRTP